MIALVTSGHFVVGLLIVAVYIVSTYIWVRYDLIPAIKSKKISEIVFIVLAFVLLTACFTVFLCMCGKGIMVPFWEMLGF